MEEGEDTGFKDRSGRSIHVDDVVQYRLGKFGKASGGPTRNYVVKIGRSYYLVPDVQAIAAITKKTGFSLSENIREYVVVLDCPHALSNQRS